MNFDINKRKIVITGHYGSGKTEFAVSLAMMLASDNPENASLALIDLDVVNPYFRSRQCKDILAGSGVYVYGSTYETEVTAEIPEIGASLRAPLENSSTRVIVDLGGNDSGARIVNQFIKYFTDTDTLITAVVNANRPETQTPEGALEHINAIEETIGLTVSHIINNTHLLRETTCADIEKGHILCSDICRQTGKELLCDCYPEAIIDARQLSGISKNLMPLGLYLRPGWLDK